MCVEVCAGVEGLGGVLQSRPVSRRQGACSVGHTGSAAMIQGTGMSGAMGGGSRDLDGDTTAPESESESWPRVL